MSGNGGSYDGFSLIEVMLAVLILSLVLTGVIAGVLGARLQAVVLTDRVETAGDRGAADQRVDAPAWMWGGPRVSRATWRTKDSLDVWVTSPAGSSAGSSEPSSSDGGVILGVWVDGWFLCEVPVVVGDGFRIGNGVSGCENWSDVSSGLSVSLRARLRDGVWGAPWRTLAPAEAGVPAAGSTPDGGQSAALPTDMAADVSGVTVHRPVAAPLAVEIEMDGVSVPIEAGAGDDALARGAIVVSLPGAARARVTLGDRCQEFAVEASRWVDVYF